MDVPPRRRSFGCITLTTAREPSTMSPSEYQELTSFFVEQLGRHQVAVTQQLDLHQKATHAFVTQQLDLQKQETRAFVGVSVESLRHEIRLVADGVLTNRRLIEDNSVRIEDNSARIEDNSARIADASARIEANGARIEALTQRMARVETAVSARLDDHEERLRVLE